MNLHNFVLYNIEKIIPKLHFAKSSVSLSTAIVSTRASDRETFRRQKTIVLRVGRLQAIRKFFGCRNDERMLWKGRETDDPFTLNGSYSRGGIGHSCNNQWGNAVVPKYGEHVCIGPVVRDSRTVRQRGYTWHGVRYGVLTIG